ncbi:MAG: glycosidase [Novosphingobium sp. SCN 66-18]|nr:MAG: glycosidase [Novosphingobium sp. SCN 66-18]
MPLIPPPPLPPRLRHCTQVHVTWIEKKREHWLRFGRVVDEQILSRSQAVKYIRPNSVFALVRWDANDYGTIFSAIDILRAVSAGEPFTTCPDIDPGGESLLELSGWPKVEQVLRAIDAVEAAGVDPCEASPDHWRHVHQRIAAGLRPRTYTMERHIAWKKRQEACS